MEERQVKHEPLVVAIDIGTTKVCAIAGRKNEYGKLEVLGFGRVDSEGVLRGVVSNIEKTVRAITQAVEQVRQGIDEPFSEVFVGIAGQHIKSRQHRGMLTRNNVHTEISRADVEQLISDMHKIVLPPGDKILHVLPQEYTVDNEQGILDPVGMSGVRLEANFHIITGQVSASNNIRRCVERAGLKVAGMTLEPIASARAVLTDEEKEAGVALVDMGGGTTDITIFQDGIIRHTAVIPFGGNVITKDIKEGCSVMKHQAERLKLRFGSALADEVYDNRIISVAGLKGRPNKEIAEKNLARIIQARVEEIFDYVLEEIRRSGYQRKLVGGIVLTGGGSLLKHIEKLVTYHTGLGTRIGIPVEHLAHGYADYLNSPVYATSIGLLLTGLEDIEAGKVRLGLREQVDETVGEAVPAGEEESETGNNWFDKLFRKTKEWFETEPDAEL